MLSVIIPAYNAENVIEAVINQVDKLPVEKEIIVVDDCSKDRTTEISRSISLGSLKVIHHASKRGKGASVRTGLENASGEFVIIRDTDLECDFDDYLRLLEAMKNPQVDIAVGRRPDKILSDSGNTVLTELMNELFGTRFKDCFSCKLIRRQSILGLVFKSNGPEIEIEILAKAIKKGMRITQVGLAGLSQSKAVKKITLLGRLRMAMKIFYFRFT